MPLERELAFYKKRLPELHEHEGKFVLIQGDRVVNFYNTYEDAINEGYRTFGGQPFLVKQIHAIEQVQLFRASR